MKFRTTGVISESSREPRSPGCDLLIVRMCLPVPCLMNCCKMCHAFRTPVLLTIFIDLPPPQKTVCVAVFVFCCKLTLRSLFVPGDHCSKSFDPCKISLTILVVSAFSCENEDRTGCSGPLFPPVPPPRAKMRIIFHPMLNRFL